MLASTWRRVIASGVLAAGIVWPALAAQQAPDAPPSHVPTDLKSLLGAPQSEMRLVVQRYSLDRNTLNGNYLAGGRGGGGGRGRGDAPPPVTPGPATAANTTISLSPNRIARLKRFDLDWQGELARIDAGKLTPAGRQQLVSLQQTITANMQQLDADATAIAEVMPLVPFAPEITTFIEHRMRMGDMDGRRAAASIDTVTKQIAAVKQKSQNGLSAAPANNAMRANRELALRAADSVDALRANVSEWFNHYNLYDPLFTWWVPLPYGHADKALVEYAAFLRGPVAEAGHQTMNAAPVGGPIAAAPPPTLSSVPDLAAIIALTQDEMSPVVQRFLGRPAGGRGGASPDRAPEYYKRWLAAIETLDFDRLSRNAQVDYLFIKRSSELAIARASATPQKDIPRKTDDSGITGPARGRDGLIRDLADEMIPYTPEELIALGNKESAWTVAEMEKTSKEMGLGTDWKQAVEKVKGIHVEPGRQPKMVRDLLHYAVDYLRKHDLITVPPIASESFRMVMLSPERQLTSPFFLGGAQILVSYPTNTMEYDTRLQSMRGNNIHFSNAVAHHEMIPGHNLVGFMGQRFNGYRSGLGGTPFLGEGWPLYWETILTTRSCARGACRSRCYAWRSRSRN